MTSALCTLFEGDYHYGVAALANSAYQRGFRGTLYVGYRGALPAWTAHAKSLQLKGWESATEWVPADGLRLVFIPLTTDAHLTNYKPDFMLALLEDPEFRCARLAYIDPDICIANRWTFFDEWLSCGVAVCEDVNSPYPETHPRRIGWRRYFQPYGYDLRFRGAEYANGGFVGVGVDHADFLRLWQTLQQRMATEIGGLDASKLSRGKAYASRGFADCFEASDQDALNAAIEACTTPVSMLGKEAMGFKHGAACALHALGHGKPWQRGYLREALRGNPPRRVDKVFWESVSGPIKPYSPARVMIKQWAIRVAGLLGRFYKRPV